MSGRTCRCRSLDPVQPLAYLWRMRSKSWKALALLLLVLPAPVSAQSRSLYWRSLDVRARLDAEGRLQVVERHHMVFTGDWNG